MKVIDEIALILVVIGAIAWGLIGIFDWNPVAAIFGADSVGARITYIIVGIAGLWTIRLIAAVAKHRSLYVETRVGARTEEGGTRPRPV